MRFSCNGGCSWRPGLVLDEVFASISKLFSVKQTVQADCPAPGYILELLLLVTDRQRQKIYVLARFNKKTVISEKRMTGTGVADCSRTGRSYHASSVSPLH